MFDVNQFLYIIALLFFKNKLYSIINFLLHLKCFYYKKIFVYIKNAFIY